MPAAVEREVARRGGALRYRSRCIDGELWRIVVTRREGPHGGRTLMYRTGKRCK